MRHNGAIIEQKNTKEECDLSSKWRLARRVDTVWTTNYNNRWWSSNLCRTKRRTRLCCYR